MDFQLSLSALAGLDVQLLRVSSSVDYSRDQGKLDLLIARSSLARSSVDYSRDEEK